MRRRRLAYVCALVMLFALSPATAATTPGTSWAQAELKTVVAAGIMAKAAAARPDDPLTRAELETIVAGLTHTEAVAPASPSAKVTIAALDARLVTALGLADNAKVFTQVAKAAGLAPPSRFGSEAVARLLGLRINHPAALDALELSPGQPATHAEAAYSAARILKFGEGDTQAVQDLSASFGLGWGKRVPQFAVRAAGPWRLRLLGIRLARLQGRAVRGRGHPPGHAPGSDDLRDERRGSGHETHPCREASAGRRPLLRSERPEVEARAGRPHGHLSR